MIYVASKFYMEQSSTNGDISGILEEIFVWSNFIHRKSTRPNDRKFRNSSPPRKKTEYDPFWAQAFAWPVSGTKVVKWVLHLSQI